MEKNALNFDGFLVVKPDGSIVGNCFLTQEEMDEIVGKEEKSIPVEKILEEWWKENKKEIKKKLPKLYRHIDNLYSLLNQKDSPILDFDKMLSLFYENITNLQVLTKKSAQNYCTWLRRLNRVSKGSVIPWILDGLSASDTSYEQVQIAYQHFEDFTMKVSLNDMSDIRAAYRKFVIFVMGYFNGNLRVSFFMDDFYLADLVARTAIFASRDVVDKVKRGELGSKENRQNGGNEYASWDCMMSKRGRMPGKKRIVCNGIRFDDNTGANYAIKQAVLETLGISGTAARKMFKDLEACHIWGDAHDEKYYQSIMNLTLVPKSLAALTDHNQYVKDVLAYRAFDLYGQLPLPVGSSQPTEPKNYDKLCWRVL